VIAPEQVAAEGLRDFLLLKLPAKCVEVNLSRAAVLRAPWAGPFTIGAGKTLGIGVTATDKTFRTVTLTAGAARTAADVAADINATSGLAGTAVVDGAGRWFVTSPTPPSASTTSKVELRGGLGTDANTVFGFDSVGAKEVRSAILPPFGTNVFDGWPITPVFTGKAPSGSMLAIVIGERKSKPMQGGPRRDEHYVAMDLTLLRTENGGGPSRTREAIQSCVRCVREILLSDRTLGAEFAPKTGVTITFTEDTGAFISAKPISFTKDFNPLYDTAVLQLAVRVFARSSPS